MRWEEGKLHLPLDERDGVIVTGCGLLLLHLRGLDLNLGFRVAAGITGRLCVTWGTLQVSLQRNGPARYTVALEMFDDEEIAARHAVR